MYWERGQVKNAGDIEMDIPGVPEAVTACDVENAGPHLAIACRIRRV
jgi:hypothetical protein